MEIGSFILVIGANRAVFGSFIPEIGASREPIGAFEAVIGSRTDRLVLKLAVQRVSY